MPNLFKKLPSELNRNKLKTITILVLLAYWGMILMGTLIKFN